MLRKSKEKRSKNKTAKSKPAESPGTSSVQDGSQVVQGAENLTTETASTSTAKMAGTSALDQSNVYVLPSTEPQTQMLLPGNFRVHEDEPTTSQKEAVMFQLQDGIFYDPARPLTSLSEVFYGEQHTVGGVRKLAIKLAAYTKSAHREAQNLLKLEQHDNIVQHITAQKFTDRGRTHLFLAMELCCTRSLRDYVNLWKTSGSTFDHDNSKNIICQIGHGLMFMHSKGIAHGDLKPGNILYDEKHKFIKIADFGLSKQIQQGNCTQKSSQTMGTKGWNSPEFYKGKKVWKRSDIFSLALIAFPLLSNGKHAFGEEETLLEYNIKHNKGLNLEGLRCPDPYIAEDLLQKMLAKAPDKRLTAEEVLKHPFFWDIPTKCSLYKELYGMLEHMKNDEGFKRYLNQHHEEVTGQSWHEQLRLTKAEVRKMFECNKEYECILYNKVKPSNLQDSSPYLPSSTYHLLRFIRNQLTHETSGEGKMSELYGRENPMKGLWKFYSQRFPRLFIFLWNSLSKEENHVIVGKVKGKLTIGKLAANGPLSETKHLQDEAAFLMRDSKYQEALEKLQKVRDMKTDDNIKLTTLSMLVVCEINMQTAFSDDKNELVSLMTSMKKDPKDVIKVAEEYWEKKLPVYSLVMLYSASKLFSNYKVIRNKETIEGIASCVDKATEYIKALTENEAVSERILTGHVIPLLIEVTNDLSQLKHASPTFITENHIWCLFNIGMCYKFCREPQWKEEMYNSAISLALQSDEKVSLPSLITAIQLAEKYATDGHYLHSFSMLYLACTSHEKPAKDCETSQAIASCMRKISALEKRKSFVNHHIIPTMKKFTSVSVQMEDSTPQPHEHAQDQKYASVATERDTGHMNTQMQSRQNTHGHMDQSYPPQRKAELETKFLKLYEENTKNATEDKVTATFDHLETLEKQVNPVFKIVDFPKGHTAPQSAEYVPDTYYQTSTKREYITGQTIQIEQFLDKSHHAVLTAGAGAGKTTTATRFARMVLNKQIPSLNHIKLVHFVRIASLDPHKKYTVFDLLFNQTMGPALNKKLREFGQDWVQENLAHILLVLDGLDQAVWKLDEVESIPKISYDTKASASVIIHNIMNEGLLGKCKVLLTSREHAITQCHFEKKQNTFIALTGLSEDDTLYLIRALAGNEGQAIEDHLKLTSPGVLSLCRSPMHQSVQETLCALNIATMPTEEFRTFMSENLDNSHFEVRRILVGILLNPAIGTMEDDNHVIGSRAYYAQHNITTDGDVLKNHNYTLIFPKRCFFKPSKVKISVDADNSKCPLQYIPISPTIEVECAKPLQKPVQVTLPTWCSSENSEKSNMYEVLHYEQCEDKWEVINTSALTSGRAISFQCRNFSPITAAIKKEDLGPQKFWLSGFVYTTDHGMQFKFFLGERNHKKSGSKPGTQLVEKFNDIPVHLHDTVTVAVEYVLEKMPCSPSSQRSFRVDEDFLKTGYKVLSTDVDRPLNCITFKCFIKKNEVKIPNSDRYIRYNPSKYKSTSTSTAALQKGACSILNVERNDPSTVKSLSAKNEIDAQSTASSTTKSDTAEDSVRMQKDKTRIQSSCQTKKKGRTERMRKCKKAGED